ncbi:MAG: PAC2 family protein [Candidatus Bathyarchaeia archaeon]
MSKFFKLLKHVQLHKASMVIGLSGWGNAGEASTLSVSYLIDKLKAEKIGEIPSVRFYVYQIQRPLVAIKAGLVQDYRPLRNDLFCWKDQNEGADLVFLLGAEPHLNWVIYAQAVLNVAESLKIRRIYTLGGYLADPSLTGASFVTGSSNNREIIAELKSVGVELVDYKGPTSVYSEILWSGKAKNVDVVSLWCAVPFYGEGPNPEASYDLLSKLMAMLDLKLELTDLKKKADSFAARISAEVGGEMRRLTDDFEKRPSFLI